MDGRPKEQTTKNSFIFRLHFHDLMKYQILSKVRRDLERSSPNEIKMDDFVSLKNQVPSGFGRPFLELFPFTLPLLTLENTVPLFPTPCCWVFFLNPDLSSLLLHIKVRLDLSPFRS